MYLKDVLLNSTLLYPFECTLCYGPILKACCACLCQLLWAASVFELSLSLCVCLYTIHVHLVYQKSSAYMYLNFIIGLVCRPARSCVCRQCMHTFALCTSLYDGSNVILNHTQKVYKQRGFFVNWGWCANSYMYTSTKHPTKESQLVCHGSIFSMCEVFATRPRRWWVSSSTEANKSPLLFMVKETKLEDILVWRKSSTLRSMS